MKTSKKLLSIILAAVMMLSFVSVAFAADSSAILNATRTITLTSGEGTKIEFSTEKAGIYRISTEFTTKGFSDLTVKSEKTAFLIESSVYHGDDFSSGESCMVYAEENDTITIKYNPMTAYGNKTINAELSISYEGNNILSEGTATASPENTLFVFAPEETGYYNFRSNASKGTNPYIKAFDDQNWFTLSENYDDEDDFNFDLTEYFEAGRYYIVKASSYNEESEPYEFTVSHVDAPEITEIYLSEYRNTDTIVLKSPAILVMPVFVEPYYAIPTADIEVSVGDSSILSASYDKEGNNIRIITQKAGTTTLTITSADGCRCEYTVKVQSRFISMIMFLLSRLADFISGIFSF